MVKDLFLYFAAQASYVGTAVLFLYNVIRGRGVVGRRALGSELACTTQDKI